MSRLPVPLHSPPGKLPRMTPVRSGEDRVRSFPAASRGFWSGIIPAVLSTRVKSAETAPGERTRLRDRQRPPQPHANRDETIAILGLSTLPAEEQVWLG